MEIVGLEIGSDDISPKKNQACNLRIVFPTKFKPEAIVEILLHKKWIEWQFSEPSSDPALACWNPVDFQADLRMRILLPVACWILKEEVYRLSTCLM